VSSKEVSVSDHGVLESACIKEEGSDLECNDGWVISWYW